MGARLHRVMARAAAMPAVAAALLCACGAARAQSYTPMFVAGGAAQVRSLTSEQKQERQFLRDAAAHVRFSQAAAKLALDKSGNARVREHAAAALNHANVMQSEVQSLLHARGMAMPMATNDERRVLSQLQKSSGAKFDRIYIDEVALRSGQQDAVRYERIAAVARDPRLVAWVQRHLPTLRYHVAIAGRGVSATSVMGAGPPLLTRPRPRPAPPSV